MGAGGGAAKAAGEAGMEETLLAESSGSGGGGSGDGRGKVDRGGAGQTEQDAQGGGGGRVGSLSAAACERLPKHARFRVVDAVGHLPHNLCRPEPGAGSGGGCEVVLIKEVLIHLTLQDGVRVLEHVGSLARASAQQGRPLGFVHAMCFSVVVGTWVGNKVKRKEDLKTGREHISKATRQQA